METIEVLFVGLLGLFTLIPPAVFVMTVVAFALAPDPPARAPQNLRDAWKMFGVALIPLPLVVALHFAAPIPDTDVHFFGRDSDVCWLAFFDALMVGGPLVLGLTWFRRLGPSRTVRVLFTVTGLCTGIWFALFDYLTRALRGL
jgi:ABC-type antimicrobial peptide transport system permease subunit